jgi:hypothetical protein
MWKLAVALGLFVASGSAFAQPKVRILIEGAPIPGLLFPEPDCAVRADPAGAGAREVAIVRGRFDRPGWSLAWSEAPNRPLPSEFSLEIPLRADSTTPVEFIAVDTAGELVTGALRLERVGAEAAAGDWSFLAMLGPTFLSYTEAGISPTSSSALGAELGLERALGSFELRAAGYASVLPIGSSVAEVSTRLIEAELGASWEIPLGWGPWTVRINGDWHYATMVVTGGAFGYRDLVLPELYPTVERRLGPRDAVSLELRVIPVVQTLSVLPLSSHEIGISAAWRRGVSSRLSFVGAFGYRALAIHQSSLDLSEGTTTLSFGMEWR